MIFNGEYKNIDLKTLKVGIVVSRFNELITKELLNASVDTFVKSGLSKENIDICWVPGAHEIPFALQLLAERDTYNGLVALGCVIKGDTAHFELVINAVNEGTLRVMLDHKMPITTGVLATYNLDQALARSQSNSPSNKGVEAASALLELIGLKYCLC